MENVNPISVPRAEAAAAYQEYVEALRRKKNDFLHDLKVAYGHMRFGRQVIDVWDALKATGLDERHDPKVAIAPADAKTVTFFKSREDENNKWQGRFTAYPDVDRKNDSTRIKNGDVLLPKGTYGNGYLAWSYPAEGLDATGHLKAGGWSRPLRNVLRAVVPIIPARFIPDGSLHGYHILWEVDRWDDVTPPRRDPMLLKRINANSFVVIAAWELTDLERAILRGRLA